MSRVRALVAIVFAVSILMLVRTSQAQYSIDAVRGLWTEGDNYPQVIAMLLALRPKVGGKTSEIDYMIGTSYCRIPKSPKWPQARETGQKWLIAVLDSYPLPDADLSIVTDELHACQSNSTFTPAVIGTPAILASGGSGVSNKMGTFSGSEKMHALGLIELKEISTRLFAPDQVAAAEKAARARMSKALRVGVRSASSMHVVVVGVEANSGVAQSLEEFLSFLVEQYGLRLPNALITVYLARNAGEAIALANSVHLLSFPEGALGYSYYPDLSIVGYKSGTWLHELTHLIIRSSFGDAPPWLHEGLATLYEQCSHEGKIFRGISNYRIHRLRMMSTRPKISELIEYKWNDFSSGKERDLDSYAAARGLLLYLQDNGKITEVLESLNVAPPESGPEPAADVSRQALEQAFGKPLQYVEADMDTWLKNLRDEKVPSPLEGSAQESSTHQLRIKPSRAGCACDVVHAGAAQSWMVIMGMVILFGRRGRSLNVGAKFMN